MTRTKPDLALVLGATGGIGGEAARQLRDAGWQVRALKRGLRVRVGIDRVGLVVVDRLFVEAVRCGAGAASHGRTRVEQLPGRRCGHGARVAQERRDAEAAGMHVVMDLCLMVEHARLR